MNGVMTMLLALCRRDLALAFRQRAELVQPLWFFLIVISLFPLGIGPSPHMLQSVAPGVIWIAVLLSSLLGLERLFRDDYQDGSLEQWLLSPLPLPLLVLAKVICHWLVSALPLILMLPLAALFLNMTSAMFWAMLWTLLLGSPVLSLLGAISVSLTLGLNRGGVLHALLLLPLFIPLLIFATGAVEAASLQLAYQGHLAIIAAMLLLALALAPFAAAYGLKVSQE